MIRANLLVCLLFFVNCWPAQGAFVNERFASWQYCTVSTDELLPVSQVTTYAIDTPQVPLDTYGICRVMPVSYDGQGNQIKAQDIKGKYYPGGVICNWRYGDQRCFSEIFPLIFPDSNTAWQGAAVYQIKTDGPLTLLVGDASHNNDWFGHPRTAWMRAEFVAEPNNFVELSHDILIFSSKNIPLKLAVTVYNGKVSLSDGGIAKISVDSNASLVIGWAKDIETAKKLSQLHPAAERAKVEKHYAKLLQNKIETPEAALNDAFKWAQINLEYNWLRPYGWIEGVGKWPTFWHMQASVGAGLLGQHERSRTCINTHADNLFESGAVPHFNPGFGKRRDFGGANQFFFWQVLNYWRMTADQNFPAYIAPKLDKILVQTRQELDPENDGLLAWGPQIGNQEDFIKTPYNGTSPTIEYIQMLKTRATIAAAMHDEAGQTNFENAAARSLDALKRELWLKDLGRFAYYKDSAGQMRLDGQYHTYIYPVIYGVLDEIDSWCSIRHLRDRFIDADDAVYTSNNFATHVNWTAGMAATSACQAWGARGLAEVGLCNQAYKPLLQDARKVMNDTLQGSWYEIDGSEGAAVFFSPPAAMYIWGVVESIFGLRPNIAANEVQISPCFPLHWPKAALDLPDYKANYSRNGSNFRYSIETSLNIKHSLCWKLPVCKVESVKVNGRNVNFEVFPQVNAVLVKAQNQPSRKSDFEIQTVPIDFTLDMPLSVAEGDRLKIDLKGVAIEAVIDRCGLFSDIRYDKNIMQAKVSEGLIKPYAEYGRLGLLNFSRRSAFLKLNAQGTEFYAPLDLLILPRYEASLTAARISDGNVNSDLVIRNNTTDVLAGPVTLLLGNMDTRIQCKIQPRAQQQYHVSIKEGSWLTPGTVHSELLLTPAQMITAEMEVNSLPCNFARHKTVHLNIPQDIMVSDANHVAPRQTFPPFNFVQSLSGVDANAPLKVPGLCGVDFQLIPGRYAIASAIERKTAVEIPIASQKLQKLYFLVIPYLDNHDIFSKVCRIEVFSKDLVLAAKDLFVPGDLDFYWSDKMQFGYGVVSFISTDFGSYRFGRPERLGLLNLVPADAADYLHSRPPEYPQPQYWSKSPAYSAPKCVMSVIEMPLPQTQPVDRVRLHMYGSDNAIAIVALTGLAAD